MKTSNSFYLISKSLDIEFRGQYNLLRQLVEYMELYSLWEFQGKLQRDGSFFCSDKFLSTKLGLSRCTILKNKKELKERGYIDFYSTQKEGIATYIKLNVEKIDKIQNRDEKETIDDYEFQDSEAVAKNATVAESFSVTRSDGYILKPTETSSSYATRVKDAWNALAKKYDLPQILQCKDDRLRKFRSILKLTELDEVDFFKRVDEALASSKFLRGIGSSWRADFDFLLQKKSIQKLLEGAYRDNKNQAFQKIQDVNTMSYKEAQSLRQEMLYQEMLRKEQEELKQIGG